MKLSALFPSLFSQNYSMSEKHPYYLKMIDASVKVETVGEWVGLSYPRHKS